MMRLALLVLAFVVATNATSIPAKRLAGPLPSPSFSPPQIAAHSKDSANDDSRALRLYVFLPSDDIATGQFRVCARFVHGKSTDEPIAIPITRAPRLPGSPKGYLTDPTGDHVPLKFLVSEVNNEWCTNGIPLKSSGRHEIHVSAGNTLRTTLAFTAPQLTARFEEVKSVKLAQDADHVNYVELSLRLSEVIGDPIHRVSADVYDAEGSPVCWIAEAVQAAGSIIKLHLHKQWLVDANARFPLQLRNVRLVDMNTFHTISTLEQVTVDSGPSLLSVGTQPSSREEMEQGPNPFVAKMAQAAGDLDHTTLLVHGYCSSSPGPFTYTDFSNYSVFQNFKKGIEVNDFAVKIWEWMQGYYTPTTPIGASRAPPFPSCSIVAHSQGGLASLHLYAYYWSCLDMAPDGARKIQSVGSPYQGTDEGVLTKLAESLSCGVVDSLTYHGAAKWLATMPLRAREAVHFYTTASPVGATGCSVFSSPVLSRPNDGVVETVFALLPGGHYEGHKYGYCHSAPSGFMTGGYPSQCHDSTRNVKMNQLSKGSTTGCPDDCSGRGECSDGKCSCNPGYHGFDCSVSADQRVIMLTNILVKYRHELGDPEIVVGWDYSSGEAGSVLSLPEVDHADKEYSINNGDLLKWDRSVVGSMIKVGVWEMDVISNDALGTFWLNITAMPPYGAVYWTSNPQDARLTIVPFCLPGTRRSGYDCIVCPAGSYQPVTGQTYCILCPAGTYGTVSGAFRVVEKDCFNCTAGTYSPADGSTTCFSCPSNTYSTMIAATSPDECKECPGGIYSTSGSTYCYGCDGVAWSSVTYDACGVCGGDGSSCAGCDGVPNSDMKYDECGVCGGNSSTCLGCDGHPNSHLVFDACGVCGGHNQTCVGCDGIPNSHARIDACGVCKGDNSTCAGCDGVPNSGLLVDHCGVCGGNDSSCAGCDGRPNSGLVFDVCGACNGTNTTCAGCDGVPNSGLVFDACGVCDGTNASCAGCDGVPHSGLVPDCAGVCGGSTKYDACGVCGGDGTSCASSNTGTTPPPLPPAAIAGITAGGVGVIIAAMYLIFGRRLRHKTMERLQDADEEMEEIDADGEGAEMEEVEVEVVED